MSKAGTHNLYVSAVIHAKNTSELGFILTLHLMYTIANAMLFMSNPISSLK